MKYEVQESEDTRSVFTVTSVQTNGEIYTALFSGPKARERAEEYAAWKNSESNTPKVAPQSR